MIGTLVYFVILWAAAEAGLRQIRNTWDARPWARSLKAPSRRRY